MPLRLRALVGVLATLWLAGPARAELSASLTPQASQQGRGDFRPAELTLTNLTGQTLQAIQFQMEGGGMRLRYPLAVPPGQQVRTTVLLPPVWPIQRYRLEGLNAAGAVVGSTSVEITWPAELVATGQFVDESFEAFRTARPAWRQQDRSRLLWFCAVFVLGAAGLVLIRRWLLRLAGLAVLTAGACGLWLAMPVRPAAVELLPYYLETYDPAGQCSVDSFVIASSRRDSYLDYRADQPPHMVYISRSAAGGDNSLVQPQSNRLSADLPAGAIAVIRPAVGAPCGAGTQIGSFQRGAGDEVLLQFGHVPAGLLLDNGYFWKISPGQQRFAASDREVIWSLFGRPEDYGLNHAQVRLLNYWLSRRAATAQPCLYLVRFVTDNHLVVQVLSPAPTSAPTSQAGSIDSILEFDRDG